MDKKYVFNFVVFFIILILGFLAYRYWQSPDQDNKAPVADIGLDFAVDDFSEPMDESGKTNSSKGEPAETEEIDQNLQIDILQEGIGVEAKNGDKLSVHYTGMLENNDVFDSSLGRGQPFSFTLGAGSVIRGWDIGLLGMKVGEKRKLTIPPELGYGSAGAGSAIPPNSVLIFEVELMEIQ